MFSQIPPVTGTEVDPSVGFLPGAFQIFHSTVSNASYRSRGEDRAAERHCIFHYTVKGHGEVLYRGMPYITSPGEGFFNIINEKTSGYGYPADSGEPWEFVVICFDGGNTREAVERLLENKVIYSVPSEARFSRMCKELLNSTNPEIRLTFFPQLIAMLRDADRPVAQLSYDFQQLVDRELLDNPTIAAIAHRLKVSREHLQREFLKQSGKTPGRYLAEKRFERLCSYLSEGLPEERIARIMNFSSVSGMIIFFKRHAGVTPQQYRKNGFFAV